MNLLERLDEYFKGDDDLDFRVELQEAYPKLRAVVLSAKRMKDMAAVDNHREAESACADLFEDLEALEESEG